MWLLLTLITLLLLITSCHHSTETSPPEFKAYQNNPILSPGEPGSFDELTVGSPKVILDENVYYMFYLASDVQSRMSVGLATSRDGLNFTKFSGNPVLAPDNEGFDAYTAAVSIIVKTDSGWAMYYNGQELAFYTPGGTVGRATATQLTGPWIKDEEPVLESGSMGEWDAGFTVPSSVIRMEDGSFLMYYSGGQEISNWKDFYIGMATSEDGTKWAKYNDPATTQRPYAESDPIIKTGATGDWENEYLWMPHVIKVPDGFHMYFTQSTIVNNLEVLSIGYATSQDGIRWEKYSGNPLFCREDDPYAISLGIGGNIENSFVLFTDTTCFLYYDYAGTTSEIGVAVSVPSTNSCVP